MYKWSWSLLFISEYDFEFRSVETALHFKLTRDKSCIKRSKGVKVSVLQLTPSFLRVCVTQHCKITDVILSQVIYTFENVTFLLNC